MTVYCGREELGFLLFSPEKEMSENSWIKPCRNFISIDGRSMEDLYFVFLFKHISWIRRNYTHKSLLYGVPDDNMQ